MHDLCKQYFLILSIWEQTKNKAVKVLLDLASRSSATEALRTLDRKFLSSRRNFYHLITMYKCMYGGINFDHDFSLTKNSSVHN